ncbi:MAG: hypothetical protein RLP44_24585 [Aggregatilineales bacterium]
MKNFKRGFWFILPILALMMGVFVLAPAPAQAQTYDVYMAYQTYDNGFMIWRSDTGAIYAFYNNSGLRYVALPSYGNLPDNPVQDPTPPNHIRPIRGFGKVWGNFADVRIALGWATSSEQGFSSNVSIIPATNQTTFTLPDGARVLIGNGSWSFTTGIPQPPPPNATPTLFPPTPPPPYITPTSPTFPQPETVFIASTYQYFERGLMIWWSDGGTVWVFANNGAVYSYAPNSYGILPDNPFYYPPFGYVRPIMGFGKVWGNYANIRNSLGWATTFEQSYTATVERVSPISGAINIIITEPNGQRLVVRDNGTWYFQF